MPEFTDRQKDVLAQALYEYAETALEMLANEEENVRAGSPREDQVDQWKADIRAIEDICLSSGIKNVVDEAQDNAFWLEADTQAARAENIMHNL